MIIKDLKILNKLSGNPYAVFNNKKIPVLNGDLIDGDFADCKLLQPANKLEYFEILMTFENNLIIEKYKDKYGLIDLKEIKPTKYEDVFIKENKFIFVNHKAVNVINYLQQIKNQNLFDIKIRFTNQRIISSRAWVFGITFQKALELKNTHGVLSPARFYCQNKRQFAGLGVIAEMLVNTYIHNKHYLNIQIWQGIENDPIVYYAHGIIDKTNKYFTHFDCSEIIFSKEDKNTLFKKNQSLKGGEYKKILKIDGKIDTEIVYKIARLYFPLDELIDEYFEINQIE